VDVMVEVTGTEPVSKIIDFPFDELPSFFIIECQCFLNITNHHLQKKTSPT